MRYHGKLGERKADAGVARRSTTLRRVFGGATRAAAGSKKAEVTKET
jgi:hypothetical protein